MLLPKTEAFYNSNGKSDLPEILFWRKSKSFIKQILSPFRGLKKLTQGDEALGKSLLVSDKTEGKMLNLLLISSGAINKGPVLSIQK